VRVLQWRASFAIGTPCDRAETPTTLPLASQPNPAQAGDVVPVEGSSCGSHHVLPLNYKLITILSYQLRLVSELIGSQRYQIQILGSALSLQ
jgi:hypothetical protein